MSPADATDPPSGLVDHYRNPRNVGDLPEADAVALVHNPVCGDMLRLAIRVDAERVVDARFKAYGCAAAIAASSVATELIIGSSIDDAAAITDEQIVTVLGELPPMKTHAIVLAREGVQQAIARLSEAGD